jgi:hypothetical protein
MAGVPTNPPGSASFRARPLIALAAATAMLALLLIAQRSAAPPAAQAKAGCPAPPKGLSPTGPARTRFTMLIRINTKGNVKTWTKPGGGLASRVRPRDIFLINTRFEGTDSFPAVTPTVAARLATKLHRAFPCNRIIALNGMSFDPTKPGYAFSLIDHPSVFALITDYERLDWEAGRLTDPERPRWADSFELALPLIQGWNLGVASTVAANPAGAGKQTGLAPQDHGGWNFGEIAQDLNEKNARLGAPKLGPLAVQTQDACARRGAAGFRARAKKLLFQYQFEFIKETGETIPLDPAVQPSIGNLAMELSFSDSPDPTATQSILRTSPATAASCVQAGLKQGIGAFFFFAAEDGMRLLFQKPKIAKLRPPPHTGGVRP